MMEPERVSSRVDAAYAALDSAVQELITAYNVQTGDPAALNHHYLIIADERSNDDAFVNVFVKQGDAPWDAAGIFGAAQLNGQLAEALTGRSDAFVEGD